MNEQAEISREEIDKFYEQLKKDAAAGGYNLNPDAGVYQVAGAGFAG